ncbi:MAG: hypothetical protein HY811_12165 [Planctomycetes bacterium]|nr:hypothetical protein [Planctomycetota bacterium]
MKYNSFGLTIEEEQILGAYSGIVSSGYNIVGKQTGLTYPSGKALTFVPDELNRNKEIKDSVNNIIAKYTYAGPGYRVTEREYLNQTKLTVGWDDNRRITSYSHVTISNPPSVIAGFEYAYDKEDNKKYEKRTHENKGDAYNHDSIYRLVGVKYGVTNLAPTTDYTDYTTWEKKEEYNFDGVGNRESLVTTLWGQNPTTKNYTTNSLNQYMLIDGNSYVYDNNGNLKDDGVNLYAYDYANRLIEIRRKSDNELIASFKYDALGRRISKTNSQQQTTKYYLDGVRVIEERDGSNNLLATYVHGNGIDELLTMERNSNTYYYHENTQGSIYAVTNSSGVIVEKYTYDPYGKVSIFDGSGNPLQQSAIGNVYLYTGREYDTETGLYYYRARYYSPELGRFLARDPQGYDELFNPYAYCGNNPANLVDPFGLYAKSKQEIDPGAKAAAEFQEWLEYVDALIALEEKKALIEKHEKEAERQIKELETELKELQSHWAYKLCWSGAEYAFYLKSEIERLKGNANYLANLGQMLDQAIYAAMESVFTEVPEFAASVLWEPADLALTIEDIREHGFSWYHGLGLLPFVPGTTRRFIKKGDDVGDVAKNIPGSKHYTGDKGIQEAFSHLKDYHGLDPNVASNRLHKMKESVNLGPADNVIIGATGDVYHPITGDKIGSLTDPSWGK